MPKLLLSALLAVAIAAVSAGPAGAVDEHVAPIMALVKNRLRGLMQADIVTQAVKAQNAMTAHYSQAEIDRLDRQWRSESAAGSGPLIAHVLQSPLSDYLAGIAADSRGLLTEIFVMDARGLNVGQSERTTDYWQGDEEKWRKSFAMGAAAVFIDAVELDDSTRKVQSQVSFAIIDPVDRRPIGAATIGIAIDRLGTP